jgi:hypothetical protein
MFRWIVASWIAVLAIGTVAAKPVTDLDAAGALLAKQSGQPLRLYSTRDFGRDKFPGARSVLVSPSLAQPLVQRMRAQLGPGLVVFVGNGLVSADVPASGSAQELVGLLSPQGVEVVVGKGASQFDILRIAATDAVNYSMGTEDLIRKLKQWDAAFGIDIDMADTDTIQLRLKTLPSDIHAFAKELYAFCPDIVDQGVGSVEKLEQSLRESRAVFLWWD